jgi:hypothetical protein
MISYQWVGGGHSTLACRCESTKRGARRVRAESY